MFITDLLWLESGWILSGCRLALIPPGQVGLILRLGLSVPKASKAVPFADKPRSPELSEQAHGDISDSGGASSPSYQLTVKRGFLALIVMHASQLLVGLALSYGARLIPSVSDGTRAIDGYMLGMTSVLLGGAIVLLWVWTDVRRFGPPFLTQLGLGRSVYNAGQIALLVVLLLVGTHFLAWTYRSVVLPSLGQGGIIGGGTQMFAHIRGTGSMFGMAGFLVLALIVGPVMEEFIFRGYLQSALARRLPAWGAITITSLLFMAGHGPTILWPMYFGYSVAWGWVFMKTKSLKAAIAIHVLSNLFYTVLAVMGWIILA
ncbi:MAG: lysostaphin resistance A-like protein [Planctomycetota bacterium]